MADISTDELKSEIHSILKTADLSVISAKKVREQVERKLNCSLSSRKKEFDKIVMDFINTQHEESDNVNDDDEYVSGSEEEDNASSSNEKMNAKKRVQPVQRKSSVKKRKSLNACDSVSDSNGGSDSDYEVPKKKPLTKNKKKSGSRKEPGSRKDGTARKSTGFTRSYNLSPELSALMGAESLPRHEVVKKVWAIIKERNLYDPKNKQYAICDDELMKVMRVKRFRTFGMLKHLKPHFLE